MSRAIIFFSDGMEECEALVITDILRRARVSVTTAAVKDSLDIIGSHRITLYADCLAAEADYETADILILPGGLQGTANLAASPLVAEQCLSFAKERWLAAICAAPSVLAGLALLEGRQATVYPSFEGKMAGAVLTHEPVTVDGRIITGRALGAAFETGLEIVAQLEGREKSEEIRRQICY